MGTQFDTPSFITTLRKAMSTDPSKASGHGSAVRGARWKDEVWPYSEGRWAARLSCPKGPRGGSQFPIDRKRFTLRSRSGPLGSRGEFEGWHRSRTHQLGETSVAPRRKECSASISAMDLGQSQTTQAEDAGEMFALPWEDIRDTAHRSR